MRPADQLRFELELPYTAAETRDRLQAACDAESEGGEGTGLRPLWGGVGDSWFRVRALGFGPLAPAAEGYIVPAASGSRVRVAADDDDDGARAARRAMWGFPAGVVAAVVGLATPGAQIPGLLVGTLFFGGAWTALRRRANAARRTRQVLMDVLTGPPPSPAKWRPRLPQRR
jgi:hypothetical protein